MPRAVVVLSVALGIAFMWWVLAPNRASTRNAAVQTDPMRTHEIGTDRPALSLATEPQSARTALDAQVEQDPASTQVEALATDKRDTHAQRDEIVLSGSLIVPDAWPDAHRSVFACSSDEPTGHGIRATMGSQVARTPAVESWRVSVPQPGRYMLWCDEPSYAIEVEVVNGLSGIQLLVPPPALLVVRLHDATTHQVLTGGNVTVCSTPGRDERRNAGRNALTRAFELTCPEGEVTVTCSSVRDFYTTQTFVTTLMPGRNERDFELVRTAAIRVELKDALTDMSLPPLLVHELRESPRRLNLLLLGG